MMGNRQFTPEFQNGRLVKLDGQRPEYMGGYDLIAAVRHFAAKEREACERIADMLGRNLGGEAFFEAEKFLKAEAPDLYDKIGMNLELGEGLRTEAEAQAEEEQK